MTVKFQRGTYKDFCGLNPIIPDGTFVLVMEIPWYKNWFGRKPNRLTVGDGKTPFKKLKFL
jgi:hypothetical protein